MLSKRLFGKKPKQETGRDFDKVNVSPEQAQEITRKYFESLGLDYQISYGNPEICNRIYITPGDFDSDTMPGEYQVPIILKDKDGTEIEEHFYVNSQTGTTREELKYKPDKQRLEARMATQKEHYLVVRTKDLQTATNLIEKIYEAPEIRSVVLWDNQGMDNINSAIIGGDIHGMGITREPVLYKNKDEKPKEKLK